jgi:hypothetical protein
VDGSLGSYCKRTGQQQQYIIWLDGIEPPSGAALVGGNMEPPAREVIDHIFNAVPAFKPLSPKTMHYLLSAAIVNGVANPYLFLGESSTRRNFIGYLNPVGRHGAATEGN